MMSAMSENVDTTEAPAAEAEVKPTSKTKRQPSPVGQAVGGTDVDTVSLSRCIVKNVYSKKSLSVHHVQRRLGELGYTLVWSDRDGWLGDHTLAAIAAYQSDNGLEAEGLDLETLEHLFDDDINVNVEP